MTNNDLHLAQHVTLHEVSNRKLCIFSFGVYGCLFESYEVSEFLGYKQFSSLRKQTLTDWRSHMVQGTDFLMVHDEDLLKRYDELFFRVHAIKLVKTKPSRGRLFFTLEGIAKILKKTSKPTAQLEAAIRDKETRRLDDYTYFLSVPPDVPKTKLPTQPMTGGGRASVLELEFRNVLKSSPADLPLTTKSKDERMLEYEVMQTLLKQLERLKEPPLRELAITAAEVALGRSLPDLRDPVLEQARGATSKSPKPNLNSVANPKPTPAGDRFTQEGYYSMTRIGEKAGGYSAKQAGQAADIVASRLGYTREQIRNEQLPFNEIALRPDTSTGKRRPMVRFNRDFSNRVLDELRSNTAFQPSFTPGPSLPSFSEGVSYPMLSKGVFDEEDSTPPASRQT